jgi:hypothetical protein
MQRVGSRNGRCSAMVAATIQECPIACPNMNFKALVLLSIPKAPIVYKSQEDEDEQNGGNRILLATSFHMLLKFEHVLN